MTSYELAHSNNGVGLKNQITIIILLKIWHINRFSKVQSYNFHFYKNDVAWQSEWNSNVVRFTTHIKPALQQIKSGC